MSHSSMTLPDELSSGKTVASLGLTGVSEFAQLLPPQEVVEGEIIE